MVKKELLQLHIIMSLTNQITLTSAAVHGTSHEPHLLDL